MVQQTHTHSHPGPFPETLVADVVHSFDGPVLLSLFITALYFSLKA